VTTKKATKGVMEALGKSRWPMAFLKISRTGVIEQFLWNQNASERGLEGVGVTLRHTPRKLLPDEENDTEEEADEAITESKKRSKQLEKWKDTGTRKDILLTWMGEPIFPDRSELDDETLKLGQEIATEDVDPVREREPVKKTMRRTATTIQSSKSVKSTSKKATRKRSLKSESAMSEKVADRHSTKTLGRPKGAKNQTAVSGEVAVVPTKKRGRPKGSKNKAIMTALAEPASLAQLHQKRG
jgi:hypothetical protein